jgi:hypothetical protein
MAVNHEEIRQAVLALGLAGDEEDGMLVRFGVILASNPVDYLVLRELEFVRSLIKTARIGEKLLVDAAQWCANATFGGIMASEEWAAVVAPMVNNTQDRLEGLIAVTNVLGWGHIAEWNLDETRKQLSFRVNYSYYIDAWRERYGAAERPICFMWTGVAGGYMDLLLGNRVNQFHGREVECGAITGKDYCLFEAR